MKSNQHLKNRNIAYAMVLFCLVCFGLLQRAQAIVPSLDDGYAGGTTAEGHVVPLRLTPSSYETGIGLFSPSNNRGDNFRAAIGTRALPANASTKITATGAVMDLSDTMVSLLVLPWLIRALASARAIWQGLTDSQKERHEERTLRFS